MKISIIFESTTNMDNEREDAPEPGFFNGIGREVGKVEGKFRDIERSHKQ
jgi:hypothetical protein